jgi:hypothetical protein
VVNLGFTRYVYWLAVPFVNQQQEAITTDAGVANAGVYRLQCFAFDPGNCAIISYPVTGKKYPFDTRVIYNRHYYYPLTVPPGQERILFFRVDCRGNGLYVPFRILNPAFREQTEDQYYMYYAFFCGILVFTGIFSLVSFFWSRDIVYL